MTRQLAQRLTAAALLTGAVATYVAISQPAAQPTDGGNSVPAAPPARPAAPTGPAAASAPPSGNPLWSIPLKQLSFTRDRPVFSPSRRPPAPPPAAPAFVPPPRQVARPKEPERPTISLVGTVAGETESIGVFVETASRNVVRLRVGEDHQGWVLRAIKGREATLEKNTEKAVLEMPPPGGGDPAMVANSLPPNELPQRRAPPRR